MAFVYLLVLWSLPGTRCTCHNINKICIAVKTEAARFSKALSKHGVSTKKKEIILATSFYEIIKA
jgi:hypothetical protein